MAAGGVTAGGVVVAVILEATVGEPPQRLHPVAWLGRLVDALDRRWTHPRIVGVWVALAVPLASAILVASIVLLAANVAVWTGALIAGFCLFVTTSVRMLLTEARSVVSTAEDNVPRARDELRSLAGRDASALSGGEVLSAAVESAAENLADGLIAPLGGFVVVASIGHVTGQPNVLSLALAAGGAAWVKAVNTLDSMLGYRSNPMGWGPARLDDAVMWLPARVSALLLALASGRPWALRDARNWLDSVPSPNSGWPMGVLASAIDARLEKPGVYVLNADGTLPSVGTATDAVRTVGVAGGVAYVLAVGILAISGWLAWS